MIKRIFVRVCTWVADRHTACAALWNDIGESVLTGKSIAEIREAEKERRQ